MPESYYVITWSILYDIEISFAHSVILRRPVFLPDDVRISSFIVLIKKNLKDENLMPVKKRGLRVTPH
jgi:hypothetical protein